MTADIVAGIIKKYIPPGFFKASTFLLPPENAVQLVDDLVAHGIAVFGVGCWFYDTNDPIPIEDSYFFFSVDIETLEAPDGVPKSGELVKDFLNNKLPAKYTLVQITFDDKASDEEWKKIWNELGHHF